jgi:flagellar assembly factor FliW
MGVVLVILTVAKPPAEITANLQGPLIFNSHARLAKQIVLVDSGYTTKHQLKQE